jgi:uncharacterized protein YjiS (DUF1127 family)
MTVRDDIAASVPVLMRRHAGAGLPGRLLALLRCWRRRIRERQQLAAMGNLAWRDLSLSDIDVSREISKPFWQR